MTRRKGSISYTQVDAFGKTVKEGYVSDSDAKPKLPAVASGYSDRINFAWVDYRTTNTMVKGPMNVYAKDNRKYRSSDISESPAGANYVRLATRSELSVDYVWVDSRSGKNAVAYRTWSDGGTIDLLGPSCVHSCDEDNGPDNRERHHRKPPTYDKAHKKPANKKNEVRKHRVDESLERRNGRVGVLGHAGCESSDCGAVKKCDIPPDERSKESSSNGVCHVAHHQQNAKRPNAADNQDGTPRAGVPLQVLPERGLV